MNAIERVADLFSAHARDHVLVVTGAGISLASGIPTAGYGRDLEEGRHRAGDLSLLQ